MLVALVVVLLGCNGDDNNSFVPGPDVRDLPSQVNIENGATYSVTITLAAEGRLDYMVILKNNVQLGDSIIYNGEKEITYDFSYPTVESDNDSHVIFDFEVKDRKNKQTTETLILSVGDAPQP